MVTRLSCRLDSILTSVLIYLGNCEISATKFHIFGTSDISYLYVIEISEDNCYRILAKNQTAIVALTSDLLSYNGMDIPLQKTTSEKFLCKIFFFDGN